MGKKMDEKRLVELAKPCPFCGGKRLIVTDEETFNRLYEENGGACVRLWCVTCDLDLYDHSDGSNYSARLKKLLNKWNTREAVEDTDE